MKVLHISSNDNSGAGLCAVRISTSLRRIGVESRVLVQCATIDNPYVTGVWSKYRQFLYKAYHKLLRLFGIYIYEEDILIKQSIELGASFTRPTGNANVLKHPWVKEADIIHLHWVDNFFDQKEFLERINKPVVWTLHDEGLFYGTSHYHDMFNLEDELERKYYNIKQYMLRKTTNLSIVFLSKYFNDNFCSEGVLEGKDISVINNSVDFSQFCPINSKLIRTELGVSQDTVVFSFVAGRINDCHKGLEILINTVKRLGSNFVILAIGSNAGFERTDCVIDVGSIYDHNHMSQLLSASDYFVMPSLQEAFSQVLLEALACGVPAIVFPVSGTEELINDDNGIICKGFDETDLLEGVNLALSRNYCRQNIREDLQKRFSPEVIASQYYNLYQNVAKKSAL